MKKLTRKELRNLRGGLTGDSVCKATCTCPNGKKVDATINGCSACLAKDGSGDTAGVVCLDNNDKRTCTQACNNVYPPPPGDA